MRLWLRFLLRNFVLRRRRLIRLWNRLSKFVSFDISERLTDVNWSGVFLFLGGGQTLYIGERIWLKLGHIHVKLV